MAQHSPADPVQEREGARPAPAVAPQPARELALAAAIGNQAFARLVATRRAIAREPAAPAPPEEAAAEPAPADA